MHTHIDDVPAVEIAPGVVERILMKKDPNNPFEHVEARHYTLTKGGTVVFDEEMTEFQHYIISGRTTRAPADTSLFMPAGSHRPVNQVRGLRTHSFTHAGEGETRIFTVAYRVPRPAFRWAKSRSKQLFQVLSPHQTGIGYTQLFTEEEHAVMGALRMHAVDMQTHPAGEHKGGFDETGKLRGHRNPEEIMFFLRGTGKAMAERIVYDVRPGSFLYTREGTEHGIWNTTDDILQYICMECIKHDKCWTEKGYQGEKSSTPWT